MRRPFGLVLVLASVLFLSACTSISYRPALSLGSSPIKIPAKLQVETFVDRSPSEDKSKRALGVSATEPDTLAGDLATEVTNAVIADFLINGVFAEAGKSITNPDAVMTGEITRFYGRAGINAVGVITLPINPNLVPWRAHAVERGRGRPDGLDSPARWYPAWHVQRPLGVLRLVHRVQSSGHRRGNSAE